MGPINDNDDEVLREFAIESRENLDKLDSEFIALERDPTQKDRLGAIFRTVHTIKGTSGFLGFSRLEAVTHAGENLLSKLRDATLVLTPDMTTTLLKLIDALRRSIDSVDATGHEAEEDYRELIAELNQYSEHTTTQAKTEPNVANPTPKAPEVKAAKAKSAEKEKALAAPLATVANASPPATPTAVSTSAAAAAAATSNAETSVRVDVSLLDKLMNLVGELVLTRNQILQYGAQAAAPAFLTVAQRLNLLTTELQEGVMKTRMRPIGSVWGKLPRLVREVTMACGKKADLTTEGQETELDRTILEAINDPLLHLVRNSIDHGIESPDVRAQHGKPASGHLRLRAFHEGGQVHIEVIDDGAGINIDVVRKKGIERGLVTAERAAAMTEQEVANLIFQPGFSTAAQITNVSGRGVGMDVVKTNIEKIGGTVDLQNRPGNGTTVRIKIPLTLAIIPALLVTCQGDRFAIPQVNLVELVRLEGEQIKTNIEKIQDTLILRLRGNLLPLISLAQTLDLEDKSSDDAEPQVISIVILQTDSEPFGLIVDAINDTEEIVVKSLDKNLKRINIYGGATILGDGSVALILDAHGISQLGNISSEATATANAEAEQASGAGTGDEEHQPMLVVLVGESRIAVPLDRVARLEELSRTSIEKAGSQRLVQYRGQILPLIDLREMLHDNASEEDGDSAENYQVVVYTENDKSVGIVVDRILDIVDEPLTMNHHTTRAGIVGCTVLQGQVTELLSVHDAINSVDPSFFEQQKVAL